MQIEGYFKDGAFHPSTPVIDIPDYQRVVITIVDDKAAAETARINKRLHEFDALVEQIHNARDEVMPELERISFSEIEL